MIGDACFVAVIVTGTCWGICFVTCFVGRLVVWRGCCVGILATGGFKD